MGMLDGKVAIVTGAGRGVGKGEALLLAKEGAKVVVNDFGGKWDGSGESKSPADEVVEEIKAAGGEALPNYESVTDFNGAKRIIDTAINGFGQLNILVNNAGILRDKMIFNMTEEEFDAVINVHLKGTFNCMRHACAYFREQHKAGNVLNGRIINTASDSGLFANRGQTNYAAAKSGIATMTMVVSKEMMKYKVTANAICPLARTRLTVDATPQSAGLMGRIPKEGFDKLNPENIAPMVVYLASDEAKGVTGEVFRVGGGAVQVYRSWDTVNKISKDGRWTPQELAERVKGDLMKGLPRKKEPTAAFAEMGLM